MIRVHSKGSELVFQIKKVMLCLLLKVFSPQSCPSSSNTAAHTCAALGCPLYDTLPVSHCLARAPLATIT